MANPEHLKIVQGGTWRWNSWRWDRADKGGKVDLTGADLRWVDLKEADLSNVDLSSANISGVNLKKADLSFANLGHVDGRGAILKSVCLRQAGLIEADLRSANFAKADLQGSCLRRALLNKADLTETNLSGAELSQAHLREAILTDAVLKKADLREANLSLAYLPDANLSHADMRYCTLARTVLTRANLTGSRLFGTGRDDWIIKDVKCKYVYWDAAGKQRSPKDRDLEPGEFERLYAALPTIEYIFENGMTPIDPLIMDRVVQAIREKQPEFDIKIDSINVRGLAPSIKFTVQQEKHKKPALKEVQKGYEERINRLEAEKDHLYQLLGRAIDKSGIKLITAGPGAIVATDGSTINIQQHIHNALELQRAIANEPEGSESFAKVTKRKSLDIIGGVIEDIAKGQVKEAAKEIIKLGKDLGPIIAKTAAYAFFKSMLG
jgi:uncharacterized protein YjbI with pentapeptide repeats